MNAFNTFDNTSNQTDPLDFLVPGWERAIRALQSLKGMCIDWDGAGGQPVPAGKLLSAVHFCHHMRDAGQPPPVSVYPLNDGNVMIEWRHEDGVIIRFEVESPGRGEFMMTFPDDRKAKFWQYRWKIPQLIPKPFQGNFTSKRILIAIQYREKPCQDDLFRLAS